MGMLRPVGGYSPNIESLLVSRGGDCEVIEQYVLHPLQNAVAKIYKNNQKTNQGSVKFT
jgi:hypothetical protein